VPLGYTGWTAQERVFWIVPDIVSSCLPFKYDLNGVLLQGLVFLGFVAMSLFLTYSHDLVSRPRRAGMILIFQTIQTYVIDAFTLHAASGASCGSLYIFTEFIILLLCHSVSSSVVFALAGRVRIPVVRPSDVCNLLIRYPLSPLIAVTRAGTRH